MSKSLADIIAILSEAEIGLDCTYVGKNYTKKDLISDLYALRGNYSYHYQGLFAQMNNEVSISKSFRLKKKTVKQKRLDKITKLIKRDGQHCFYCGVRMSFKEITIEHLKAKSNGGSNALSNLKLAHSKCNSMAGSKPVDEKLEMRSNNKTNCQDYISPISDYTEIK